MALLMALRTISAVAAVGVAYASYPAMRVSEHPRLHMPWASSTWQCSSCRRRAQGPRGHRTSQGHRSRQTLGQSPRRCFGLDRSIHVSLNPSQTLARQQLPLSERGHLPAESASHHFGRVLASTPLVLSPRQHPLRPVPSLALTAYAAYAST